MPKIIFKIIPALVFWGIFIFIINQIPYPDSLTQANFTQIIPFLISLYLAFILTINILLRNILLSAI
ncbi:MAG: hypothetical protein Q8P63_03120, partial [Candidatus Nealsonbacteria bacterium]|nr:hypothetical protein [Candidatus Nealsonbacteria bacterium]